MIGRRLASPKAGLRVLQATELAEDSPWDFPERENSQRAAHFGLRLPLAARFCNDAA